jgi:hypothetical protein
MINAITIITFPFYEKFAIKYKKNLANAERIVGARITSSFVFRYANY